MKTKKGIFISDIHIPDNIKLDGVFKYMADLKPDYVILGGDIIDAQGLHGLDGKQASYFKKSWYKRDVKYTSELLATVHKICPKAEVVYLEGNHEERYRRLMAKYPETFGGDFDLLRDAKPKGMKVKWIPYGTYESYYVLGDTIFIHGTVWPDIHAKKYAMDHTPYKCVYGHLHHFQAYTTRRSMATMSPRYAVTAGCLCTTTPDYKKGAPNQWSNGFISFSFDGKTVIPTVHMIENNKFYIGGKEYK